ncbi:ATP-binding protein [Aciduricibacillus chroicocephali]|uniref:ATP-binding protein n=1 Tax=Aciduricibacillus chroicocephali TaxID=3054939 RepID=A0ABY9KUK0_9BACI|nr:ATP-binding protein [Bacillaceae bacterium 44XB]
MLHIRDKIGSGLAGDLLEEFTCGGCGREVQRKELTIPFGPRKGERIVANLGCKCENIRLAKQAVVQASRLKMRRMEKAFGQQSLLNEALRRATFESYTAPTQELQRVKERLVNYAESFDVNKSGNLLLYGDYGVGKSHLSAAISKVLIEKGHSALFLSLPKLLTQIKDAFRESSNFSEAKLFQVIGEVELFVLDDLGAEYMNPKQEGDSWVQTKLFEVLDARAGKPTIYTTNLNGAGLKQRLNDRNLSRVLERTEIIHMSGPDYRRRGFS